MMHVIDGRTLKAGAAFCRSSPERFRPFNLPSSNTPFQAELDSTVTLL
jgi:hypothetical protein